MFGLSLVAPRPAAKDRSSRPTQLCSRRGTQAVFSALIFSSLAVACSIPDLPPPAGNRDGNFGEPCLTHYDCLPELECVDGACGVFGVDMPTDENGNVIIDDPGPQPCPDPNQPGNMTPGDMNSGPDVQPGGDSPGMPNDTTTTEATPSSGAGVNTNTTTTTTTGTKTTTTTTTGGGTATKPKDTTTTPDKTETTTKDETTMEAPVQCPDLPKPFDSKSNPYNSSNSMEWMEEGKKMYVSCISCHGRKGKGGSGGPLDGAELAPKPDCYYFHATAMGIVGTNMPAFQEGQQGAYAVLTEDQIWKIIAYARTFSK